MRSGVRSVGAGLAVLAVAALTGCGTRGEWQAGWAKAELTPPWPAPLAGYGRRDGRLSSGTRDPLYARAVVLRAAGGRVAIVACDLIGISAELAGAAIRLMPGWARRDPARVLICATHTHAGPGGASDNPLVKIAAGDRDPRMLPFLAARIAEAVRIADARLVPVRLETYRGTAPGLAKNRRRADGPVLDRLDVLRIVPRRGPGVLVARYAMHPTILPASWMAFSADFPGAFARRVEAAGYDLAVFVNGAEGDQAPVSVPGATASQAVDVTGSALADRALAIIRTPGRPLPPRVAARAAGIPLPPTTYAGLIPATARLQAIDLGGLLLFAVPGEPVAEAGLAFDREAAALGIHDAWLISLANDHLGYFDTPAGFALNSYESNLTFHGPGSWPVILDAVAGLTSGGGTRAGAAARRREAERREIVGRASVTRRGGGRFLTVQGTPHEMGLQHGTLLRRDIQGLLADFSGWLDRNVGVEMAARAGVLLDPVRASVPARWWLALKARELQKFIAPELLDEIAGVAEGAHVPYDQVLLLNVFLTIAEQPDRERFLLTGPRGTCTNLVVLPPRAAGGETIHARNLDWGMTDLLPRRALVTLAEPATGRPFATVGWTGLVGSLTGLNAAGLAITEESIAAPRDSRYHGEPLQLLLRRVLQRARTLPEAVGLIATARGTCGYHVTVTDGRTGAARVLEMSAHRVAIRRPRDGALAGVVADRAAESWQGRPPPASMPRSDASSDRRYARVREVLAAARAPLDAAAARRLLRDREGGICGPSSLHSVVLLPGRFAGWVAHGSLPAAEGEFEWYDFAAELRGSGGLTGTRARLAAAFGTTAYWDRIADPVTPEVLDTESRGGVRVIRLRLPSAATSGHPENDEIEFRVYEPAAIPIYGSAVFLPMWKGRERDAEDVIARALAAKGLRVALLPMAWQWKRSPPGVRSGNWTFSADWARTRKAVSQTAADAERVARWLRDRDPVGGGVGIMGLSLGGFVASALFAAEPRFAAGVFVLAGADAADTLFGGAPDVRAVRAELDARGATRAGVRRALAGLMPGALARPERGARVLLVNAVSDRVVSWDNADRLRLAWGRPDQLVLPGDHHSVVVFLDAFLDRADRHFQRWLTEGHP